MLKMSEAKLNLFANLTQFKFVWFVLLNKLIILLFRNFLILKLHIKKTTIDKSGAVKANVKTLQIYGNLLKILFSIKLRHVKSIQNNLFVTQSTVLIRLS